MLVASSIVANRVGQRAMDGLDARAKRGREQGRDNGATSRPLGAAAAPAEFLAATATIHERHRQQVSCCCTRTQIPLGFCSCPPGLSGRRRRAVVVVAD
jgi:hypothetical protein